MSKKLKTKDKARMFQPRYTPRRRWISFKAIVRETGETYVGQRFGSWTEVVNQAVKEGFHKVETVPMPVQYATPTK